MRQRFAALGFLMLLAWVHIFASAVAEPSWDRAGAARYLDDRMDVWFANAKKVKAGDTETACVSCHTSVPYALARPALRQAMGVPAPTPQEIRMLDDVKRRVAAYATEAPFYDFNERKVVESRGTEAVLNALILASDDASHRRSQPGESTRTALARLWETQRPDGSWDWLLFGLEPWESVAAPYHGATLAALAIGSAPGAAADTAAAGGVDRLRAYLRDNLARQPLLNRVMALLASTRFPGLLLPAQREAVIADARSHQRADGGWSLDSMGAWKWGKAEGPFAPPGTVDGPLVAQSDAYATGLIVHTLKQAGVSGADAAVAKGLQWLRANQREIQVDDRRWHAWRAHSLNFDREHGGDKGEPWRRLFMSDAATAFAVLALATP